jgi:hypothetical protein
MENLLHPRCILAGLIGIAATVIVAFPFPVLAEIIVLKCDFADMPIYFTIYDDGTPVRVGVGPGVGGRAQLFRNPRNRTIVIVEQNLDGIPVTFTTITGSLEAVHSRALIDITGEIVSPSQSAGQCKNMPV